MVCRTWSVAVVTAVMVMSLAGCQGLGPRIHGSGIAATELRDVPPFQRVRVQGQGNLLVRVGGNRAVHIETDDNLLPYVLTDVDGDTLTVKMKDGQSYSFRRGLHIVIDIPAITGVALAGAFDADLHGVRGQAFEASIAGSCDIRADGEVDTVAASISGSGDIDISELRARNASVRIAGDGDVEVNVTGRLDVSISGSGDVLYAGDPDFGDVDISGSGEVRRRR